MPRKNLYVSDEDLKVWEEAARLIERSGRAGTSPGSRSVSAVVTDLLWRYVAEQRRKETAVQTDMETIRVEVGGRSSSYRPVEFEGRWLVAPDPDTTRTSVMDYDAGAYYGVALTRRGNVAVYVAHVNDGFDATLEAYESFEDAEADNVPADILGAASVEAGPDHVHVQKLDI